MAYYPPQPPVYYPPQPTYVAAPQPIIVQAGSAASSTSYSTTQKVTKVKNYGGPSKVTNKRGSTFNLNLSRSAKTPKSSKMSKTPKSSKSSKMPKMSKSSSGTKKPRKSLFGKKKNKPAKPNKSVLPKGIRPRKTKKAKKVGAWLKVSVSDKHVLRNFMDELQRVSTTATDGMVHTIKHAMFGMVRANDGKLPQMSEMSMEVAYMMLRAVHSRSGRPLQLTFANEEQQVFTSATAVPTVDNERSASATFAMPEGAFSTMDGDFAIEIKLGSQTFTHVGHAMKNSRRFRDEERETFEWMINLYDAAYLPYYYKYMVPLPVVVLTMRRSLLNERQFLISKAVLVVDFQPRKHLVSLPVKASDITELPRITSQTYQPFKAYTLNDAALHRSLHDTLATRLGALMADSPNKWAFRCSGGEVTPGGDHRVFLGAVAEAAIGYSVMAMLQEKGLLARVNDPELAKEVLAVDANGSMAVEVVRSLYAKYHLARGKEITDAHQDFPSVLQLISRTSGLPASRRIDCDQVRAYYDAVIAAFSGSADVSPADLSYDAREKLVLESFESAPGVDNDAAVSVGPAGNTFELFLIAMFIRRFASRLSVAGQTPAAIVNAYLVPKEFTIDWGLTLNEDGIAMFAADPLAFSTCAASSFSGLVSHARALSDDLARPARVDSIFFEMLSVRFPVVGESSDVAHSVGWMQRRVNEKLDVLFVGSDNDTVDSVTVMIVPQLHFFGVFHELSVDFDKPLRSSVKQVVEALVGAVNEDALIAQYADIPDRQTLAVARPSRANKTWDTSFLSKLPPSFAVDVALPAASVEFVDPFAVPTQQMLRTVRFEKTDPSGLTAKLVFSGGEIVSLVFDTRRQGFFVRLFDEEDSLLGEEAVITDKYIQYRGKVYIRRADFDEFGKRYTAAYDRAAQAASSDVFNTKSTQVFKQGVMRSMNPQLAFTLEEAESIGHRFGRRRPGRGGAFLGGLATGAALNSLAWSRYGPAYYPAYGYYPSPVVSPIGVVPVRPRPLGYYW